jgi:glycosyltransferase involved in cell wall biosynthesis
MKSPKIAIVYDWLTSLGGGERVLSHVLELYPQATVYALVFNPEIVKGTPLEKARVISSRLQSLPWSIRFYRQYLAFYPWAMRGVDLSGHDLVLSISHAAAKGAPVKPGQLHLCYCFTPMRYAWDLREQYMESLNPIKRLIANPILDYLKRWDFENSKRVHAFAGISNYIAARIKNSYGRESRVIYPAVDLTRFRPLSKKEDYFITVSRFVPYKRVDLIVRTFSEMGLPLKVVGDGPEKERILAQAGPSVEFLGRKSDEEVARLLSGARAFIFAALEDFGIAPLEALASGVPVIGYGAGGLLETVKDGVHGVYFNDQTVESLKAAVTMFLGKEQSFDSKILRARAEEFSVERFKEELGDFVESQWASFH